MIPDDEAPDRDDAAFLRSFDRLAGPPPDTRAGWADLRSRTPAPAPNRRSPRVAVLVAAAATVGFLGVVSRGGGDDRPLLQPPVPTTAATATIARPASSVSPAASSPATVPAVVPSTSPTSSAPATVPSSPAAVDATAAADPTAESGAPVPGTRSTVGPSSPRPVGTPAPPPAPSGTDATVAPAPPATVPAPPPATPKTFVVTGGTIAVPLVGGRFGAPSVTAAPGWSYEVRKAEADRVEVRFRSSGRESTTRLTLRGDGTVAVERG